MHMFKLLLSARSVWSKPILLLGLLYSTTASLFAQTYETVLNAETDSLNTSLVQARRASIRAALKQEKPILLLAAADTSPLQQTAQNIMLADPTLPSLLFEPQTKRPYLTEVMQILPLRDSDLAQVPACLDRSCFQVMLYNYATNTTFIGIAHVNGQKILRWGQYKDSQPDIPPSLKTLALHIATETPQVAAALGFKPDPSAALMPDTKTALNRTRCERSKTLCVAPTFIKEDKALWAIVNLTDLRVVGLRWTNVGRVPQPPTERRLQNEYINENYCKKTNRVTQDGWSFNYILTSSDGLRISEVTYNGKPVIESAKLVDWHVSYSNTDGFGYSDAVGCPFFSSAAVVAVEPPRLGKIEENGKLEGFTLEQNFYSEGWPSPCNYNYQQRFEFYADGRFRMAAASLGRGCGNNGTYRPVSRIVFSGNQNQFSEWDGKVWKVWTKEQWQLQQATTTYTSEGYQYKIDLGNGEAYAVLANAGQLGDGGRGDQAYTFITLNKPQQDEGESDLITIGPCCNTDYQQGPEKFMIPEAENIAKSSFVFWYVPQLKNDDREGQQYCWADTRLKEGIYKTEAYPCFSGPIFVPLKTTKKRSSIFRRTP